jgi:iron(III) transport system permease protein
LVAEFIAAWKRPSIRFRPRGEGVLLAVLVLYVLLIVALPLARLLAEAFRPGADGTTLGLLGETLQSRAVRGALANTLVAASLSTLVSLALGTALALLLKLAELPGRGVLAFLAILPMLVPPQVASLAWIELLGPTSPVLSPLGIAPPAGRTNAIYSMGGIAWVMGLEHMPLVLLAVAAGLATLPRDLIEAARVVGARGPRIVVSVVLPAVMPSVLAGAMLAFVSAVGNFGVPALLGIPGRLTLLTTLIYQRLNGFGPSMLGEVAAISLLLVGVAGAALLLHALLARRTAHLDRAALAGAALRLGIWRWPVAGAVWGLLIVVSVLPLAALATSALVPAVGVSFGLDTLSFSNFEHLLNGNDAVRRAFANSGLLAALAASVCMLIALPLSYFAVVRRSRVAHALDAIVQAPYAVPGTVLALGVIIVYLKPLPLLGISIYNSLAILLVAYLARFLLLAQRPVSAAIATLDPALDEAGATVGARALWRMAAIVAPAALPSALAGALLVFMMAFNELTVSALLWSTGNETLGVMVFQLQYEGNSPGAAALATLAVAITLLLAALLGVLGNRWSPGAVPWRV